jgi:hypothetical protein
LPSLLLPTSVYLGNYFTKAEVSATPNSATPASFVEHSMQPINRATFL